MPAKPGIIDRLSTTSNLSTLRRRRRIGLDVRRRRINGDAGAGEPSLINVHVLPSLADFGLASSTFIWASAGDRVNRVLDRHTPVLQQGCQVLHRMLRLRDGQPVARAPTIT